MPQVMDVLNGLVDDLDSGIMRDLEEQDIQDLIGRLTSAPTENMEEARRKREELLEKDNNFRLHTEGLQSLSDELMAALNQRPDVALSFWASFKKGNTSDQANWNWKFYYRVLSRSLIVTTKIKTPVTTSMITKHTPIMSQTTKGDTELMDGFTWSKKEATLSSSNSSDQRWSQRRVFDSLLAAVDYANPGDFIYLIEPVESDLPNAFENFFPKSRLSDSLITELSFLVRNGDYDGKLPSSRRIDPMFVGKTAREVIETLREGEAPLRVADQREEATLHLADERAHRRVRRERILKARAESSIYPALIVDKKNITILGRSNAEDLPLCIPIVWLAEGGVIASLEVLNNGTFYIAPHSSLKAINCTIATPFHISEHSSLSLIDVALEQTDDGLPLFTLPEIPCIDYHLHFESIHTLGSLRLEQMLSLYNKLRSVPINELKTLFEERKARELREKKKKIAEERRRRLEMDGEDEKGEKGEIVNNLLAQSLSDIVIEEEEEQITINKELENPLQTVTSHIADAERRHMEFLKTISSLLENEVFDQPMEDDEVIIAKSILPQGIGTAIRLQLVHWLDVFQENPKFVSQTLDAFHNIPAEMVYSEVKSLDLIRLVLPLLIQHLDDDRVPVSLMEILNLVAQHGISLLAPLIVNEQFWRLLRILMGKIQGTIGAKTSMEFRTNLKIDLSSYLTDLADSTTSRQHLNASTRSDASITLDNSTASLNNSTSISAPLSEVPKHLRSPLYGIQMLASPLVDLLNELIHVPSLSVVTYDQSRDLLSWTMKNFPSEALVSLSLLEAVRVHPIHGQLENIEGLIRNGVLSTALSIFKSAPLASMADMADLALSFAVNLAPKATIEYLKETKIESVRFRNPTESPDHTIPPPSPATFTKDPKEDDGIQVLLKAVSARGEKSKIVATDLSCFSIISELISRDEDIWIRVKTVFEDELLTTRPRNTQNTAFISVLAHCISSSSVPARLEYLAHSGFLQFIEGAAFTRLAEAMLVLYSIENLTHHPKVLRDKAIQLKSAAQRIQASFMMELTEDWTRTIEKRTQEILEPAAEAQPQDEVANVPANDEQEQGEENELGEEEVEKSWGEMRRGAKLVPLPGNPESSVRISESGLTVRAINNAMSVSCMVELPEDEWLTSGKWCYEVIFNSAVAMQIGWAGRETVHLEDVDCGVGDDEFSYAITLGTRGALWHPKPGAKERWQKPKTFSLPHDSVLVPQSSSSSSNDDSNTKNCKMNVEDVELALRDCQPYVGAERTPDSSLEGWQIGSALMCCVDLDEGTFMWAMDGEIRAEMKVEDVPEGGIRPAFTLSSSGTVSINLGARPMVEYKALKRGYTPICEPDHEFSKSDSQQRAEDLQQITDLAVPAPDAWTGFDLLLPPFGIRHPENALGDNNPAPNAPLGLHFPAIPPRFGNFGLAAPNDDEDNEEEEFDEDDDDQVHEDDDMEGLDDQGDMEDSDSDYE